MLDNVFQHSAVSFVKTNFTKPHKKEKENTHTDCASVLFGVWCGLVDKPRIAVIAMQGGVNALCHFGCVE